jgi:hypothetical protein
MTRSANKETTVHEDCRSAPKSRWRRYFRGSGSLEQTPETWRFVTTDTSANKYTDAQVDDYQGSPRRRFPWRPPLTMRVRARFSHGQEQLQGTAGFGFWNDPFLMTGWRQPALPRAVWFFFASPPSNMVLDIDGPGHGWKAMAVDAWRWPFILSLPALPVAGLLMNVRSLRRALWAPWQRAARAQEKSLVVDMTAWHSYEIDWMAEKSRFSVDGQIILENVCSPGGPLGFVLWLDNQYAIVTPWGRLGYGLLAARGRQWLEIDEIEIDAERFT